jgi:hypothetical protein
MYLYVRGRPTLLFTENESNEQRLWGKRQRLALHQGQHSTAIVDGERQAVNRQRPGTKATAHYR